MRKGLSPLIAAVVLIAATMSIAGILSFWATGFVRKKLTESQNISEETGCMGANFKLRLAKYDNGELTIVVDNTRDVDLKLQNVYIFYPNGMKTKTLDPPVLLKGNEMKQFHVDEVDPGFESVTIKTNCPEVSLSFGLSQVIK